jgi:hypothetical protein
MSLILNLEIVSQALLEIRGILQTPSDFEFGDNPQKVWEILDRLQRVKKTLRELLSYYDIRIPMPERNEYFDAINSLNNALEFAQKVQKSGRGTMSYTDEMKTIVGDALDKVNLIAKRNGFRLFKYELPLKLLEDSLVTLIEQHPVRSRFQTVKNRLIELWDSGEQEDSQDIQNVLRELNELSLILRHRQFNDVGVYEVADSEESLIAHPFEQPLPIERCWAVFVGVSNYSHYVNVPPASMDAWRLTTTFLSSPKYSSERTYLFTSEEPTDDVCRSVYKGIPTVENILDTLKHLSLNPSVKQNDLFLFYFSGHGILNTSAFLVFGNSNPEYLTRSGLLMSELKIKIQNLPMQVKILVLDTCHSAAVLSEKGVDPMSDELKKQVFDSAEGLAIFTSCDANQRSYYFDETNQTSSFTHYFINGLRNGGTRDEKFVTANDLNLYLTSSMLEWVEKTNKIQIPRFHWSGRGDPKLIEWA